MVHFFRVSRLCCRWREAGACEGRNGAISPVFAARTGIQMPQNLEKNRSSSVFFGKTLASSEKSSTFALAKRKTHRGVEQW